MGIHGNREEIAMFGYIRPLSAELRVREYAYYRALYCGVCKHMEKNVSPLLSLTLRYDFVLLVMLRMILTGEHGNLRPMRCLANPWHKKTVLCDADALDYTSYASALLTHRGVLDNIADEHGIKRLLYRLVSPVTAGMRKKALKKMPALSPLDRTMEQQLAALSALEHAGECSPDAAAEPFSVLLGEVFAHGLEGSAHRIAYTVGAAVGRFIYLLDAVDDAEKDEQSTSYNPFVLQAQADGIPVTEWLTQNRERIENALLLSCRTAYNAAILADDSDSHPAWACLENLLQLGMPHIAKQVLDNPGQPLSKKDPGSDTSAHK